MILLMTSPLGCHSLLTPTPYIPPPETLMAPLTLCTWPICPHPWDQYVLYPYLHPYRDPLSVLTPLLHILGLFVPGFM